MTDAHHVRHDLGAYVLGALDPAERRAVEDHLADCGACRDELAQLSGLPPLLDRITAEEATADLGAVRRRLAAAVDRAAAEDHALARRQVRRWRAATVAAGLVALVATGLAWEPWAPPPPDRLVVQVVPVAGDEVAGTVAAYAWEWGTTLELQVSDLPPHPAYLVWAVAEDGRRERAGTWGPTADGGATVRAATAVLRPDLSMVEVTTPDGAVLFAAEFDG